MDHLSRVSQSIDKEHGTQIHIFFSDQILKSWNLVLHERKARPTTDRVESGIAELFPSIAKTRA